MFKLKWCVFVGCLILTVITGSMASGQCVAGDGNDTRDDATPISFNETVSDWVCPEDPFDFYMLEIPADSDVSGSIMFSSPERSTVLRVEHSDTGTRIINDRFTNEQVHEFTVNIPQDGIPAGTYYARVFFWSEAAFDHEYTLTLDLTVTPSGEGGGPGIEIPTVTVESMIPKLAFGGAKDLKLLPPWPSRRCGAANRAQSIHNGPAGNAGKIDEYDLLADLGTGDISDGRFEDLIVGSDSKIYFIDWNLNKLIAYDASGGFLWEQNIGEGKGHCCLDGGGNVYAINENQTRLLCMDPDGNELWSAHIPQSTTSSALWAIGRRIYTSTRTDDGEMLYAWETNGDLSWFSDPLEDDEILAITEDPHGFVYVQTSLAFFQYDWQGDRKWGFDKSGETPLGLDPIIAHDRTVRVDGNWPEYPDHHRYFIYNTDGSYVHWGYPMPTSTKIPKITCFGTDDRFYMTSTTNDIVCLENWLDEVWRATIPNDGNGLDMIMDRDGIIYVLYSFDVGITGPVNAYHIAVIDSTDGSIVDDIDLEVPSRFCQVAPTGELAIGDKSRLIYLNSGGYLAVFAPVLHLPPGLLDPGAVRIPPVTGG